MGKNLGLYWKIAQNMGFRYIMYRVYHALRVKSGLIKLAFPSQVKAKIWLDLDDWKKNQRPFFFRSKSSLEIPKRVDKGLEIRISEMQAGTFTYFSSTKFDLGTAYNWIQHPETGVDFPMVHWSDIPDFSSDLGDIKYVWEKSRFCFLYDIIRHDMHTGTDHADWVCKEITSWIAANPVNTGPNWRCSQEISLRVLNWVFALYYYQDQITNEFFHQVLDSIYWQMKHVRSHIHFSRIAVRNNHAITECLALYIIGMLFPVFPEAKAWKRRGKKWFEQEIAYQIYEDGSYLQFSMNYHRVVVQLLTWGIRLSKINDENLSKIVTEKAEKSLQFLMVCQDETSGKLPNYGANDGALFFPLNSTDYRNYSGQLNALHGLLHGAYYHEEIEDGQWLGMGQLPYTHKIYRGSFRFDAGGFYVFKEEGVMTFIRCGKHTDRPSQADNLHMDVWFHGDNVICDGGSYKYNTDATTQRYFMGTASHNTLMINDQDQMQRGPRFVWLEWTQALSAQVSETADEWVFEGSVRAFEHIEKGLVHKRIIRKAKNQAIWQVKDSINAKGPLKMVQSWHFDLKWVDQLLTTSNGQEKRVLNDQFVSNYYGQLTSVGLIKYLSEEKYIKTNISII